MDYQGGKMKKLVLIVMALVLICMAFAGCANTDANGPAASDKADETAKPTATEEVKPTEKPVVIPDEAQIEEMLPYMDSVMLTLLEGNYTKHDVTNADYFWTLMYYHCVNHADEIEKAVYDQNAGTITVPEDEISAMAGAFFLEFSKLPELPKKDMMSYDEKNKSYVFMDSDRGESGSEIGATALEDDAAYVTAQLVNMESGDILMSCQFTIIGSYNDTTGRYPFTIVTAEPEEIG